MMKSTLLVIISSGLPKKGYSAEYHTPWTKKIYNTQGDTRETKHLSQCVKLSLITELIALISEVFIVLEYKYKVMMNAKVCTFL